MNISRRGFLGTVIAAATLPTSSLLAAAANDAIPIIDTHIHLFDGTRPQGAPYKGGRKFRMSLRHFARVICQNLALTLLASLGPWALAQGSKPQLPLTPEAWSAAAMRNVNAAYDQMAENHPGFFNELDPGFRGRLERARHKGLEVSAQVRDEAGLGASLDSFSAELRDGHAIAYANPTSAPELRWPGFVAVWRGNGLFVFASEVPELKAGATILGCDGTDIRSLVLRNVFAFDGRPDEPGQWWTKALNLFVDYGNPFVKLPMRCRFSVKGHVTEAVLHWRRTDEKFKAWWKLSYNGEILPVGMTEPLPGMVWIGMSTFEPNAVERETYRAMFAAVRARRTELMGDKAVVIDLRGNLGGSDFWSEELAKALWGDRRVDQFEESDPSRVWWRASRDNTEDMAATAAKLDAEGQKEMAALFHRAADGMRAALAAGQHFFIEPPEKQPLADDSGKEPASLTVPVYVIVPGNCASAGLDALDVFTHFPNTKLIGAPSSADSVYLEVRHATLPDGTSQIVIPTKMYRDRRRASGQIYRPAIEVDDLSWSTAAFEKVVEDDIKATK